MGASRKLRRKEAREQRKIQNLEAIYRVKTTRYKEELYDGFLSVYLLNIALAVYDVYGNMPTRIKKVVEAFNRRLEIGQTLEEAQKELEDKTGIYFRIVD